MPRQPLRHLGASDLGEVEPPGEVGEGFLLLPHGAGQRGRHLVHFQLTQQRADKKWG